MSATTEENTRCIFEKDHSGVDHDYVIPVHKCTGLDNCGWCPPPKNDRCTYIIHTFQTWINLRNE